MASLKQFEMTDRQVSDNSLPVSMAWVSSDQHIAPSRFDLSIVKQISLVFDYSLLDNGSRREI